MRRTHGVGLIGLGLALAAGCGGGDDGDGDDVILDPDPSFFDACGGKIVAADGSIDAAEYLAQATAWSRELIDCRLGPDHADYRGAGVGACSVVAAVRRG